MYNENIYSNNNILPSGPSGSSSESRYPSKSSSLSSEAMPAMYSSKKLGSDGKYVFANRLVERAIVSLEVLSPQYCLVYGQHKRGSCYAAVFIAAGAELRPRPFNQVARGAQLRRCP